MSYTINCNSCKRESWAGNIVELIDDHLDDKHMLKCSNCGASGGFMHLKSKTQGNENPWERWVKGVIRLDYGQDDGTTSTYHPYVFLISHKSATGKIDSVQISYYKDHRETGGRLKHGHGPGGTPVIDVEDLAGILGKLSDIGVLPMKE